MTEMLAYCGLICETCPIYLATRHEKAEERSKMRTEIARACREQYGLAYSVEDITACDGCRTESGRLFSGSRNCRVRTCAREKGLQNCAHCPEYACDKLAKIFSMDPDAENRLDSIRSGARRGGRSSEPNIV